MYYKYLFLILSCAGNINSFSLFATPKKLNRPQRKMVKYFQRRLDTEKALCVNIFSALHSYSSKDNIIDEAIIYAQDHSFIASITFPLYYTCYLLEQRKQYFVSKLNKHAYLPSELQYEMRTFIKDIENVQYLLETTKPYRKERMNSSRLKSFSRWLCTSTIFVSLI